MKAQIETSVKNVYDVDVDVTLTRPDPEHGDYATNVALQLAKQLGKSPREIAEAIATDLRESARYQEVTVAGPGFINIRLSVAELYEQAMRAPEQTRLGQTVVAEYSDPNPFKVLHAGHLYTTIVGDSIARLVEATGASVHRVNFGGDVGLHVAKNMWAILQHLDGEHPDKLDAVAKDLHARADWLSARYVEGNIAYETSETDKQAIIAVNKRVYAVHADDDHDSSFAEIYWTARAWSYDYFALLYDELQVKPFEKYYPESATTPTGLETIEKQLANGVYEKSDGAVVFKGEPYGLHTRVFINSNGLPTYEAKDVGLIMQKWHDYQFDQSIIITGNDIIEYMKVVQKSIEQYEPELVARSLHLTHGNLKLAGGQKMSSRKGTVLLAMDILAAAEAAQKEAFTEVDQSVVLGAVKYAFLANRIGGDILYDPISSVSLQGNSGPYLQYAHARARSILAKADVPLAIELDHFDEAERLLVRKLGEYAEVIEAASSSLMPHLVCTYLYELCQVFNRFYESSRIIGDDRQDIRLHIAERYANCLRDGLTLLGITAPDKV